MAYEYFSCSRVTFHALEPQTQDPNEFGLNQEQHSCGYFDQQAKTIMHAMYFY